MSEFSPQPGKDLQGRSLVTRRSLAAALRSLDVAEGQAVCVHPSLSRLGWVCGGPRTVVESLLGVVGADGAVMMPAFSGELSDPAEWHHPSVPQDWIDIIRAETPPYDAARTPSRLMGVIPEYFRTWPGAMRSSHPQSSFAAAGGLARALVGSHGLDYRFGPASPLGRLADLDGRALLLGAGPERASLVYLALTLAGIGPEVIRRAPVQGPDGPQWVSYRDVAIDNRYVSSGMAHLIATGVAVTGQACDAPVVLVRARSALRALLRWRWNGTGLDTRRLRDFPAIPMEWGSWLGDGVADAEWEGSTSQEGAA